MKAVGKFQILRTLGTGRQSTVLQALDPDLQRKVAIKLLHLRDQPAERRSELMRQARAIGVLRHPNIVPVYEAGEHGGDPYLVYEYVEGQTLAQRIRDKGPLSPEQAATVMIDVLDALDHAHESGIVHRDLKPSNILITPSGQARVTDFGVAARLGESDAAGEGLVGTPSYMAPEYVARGEIGPENDIFAAGLVLYEALFAHRAIEGDGVFQILHAVVNDPLVLPADAAEHLSEELLDTIAKATAKETTLRFRTAREMRAALQRYLKPDTAEVASEPRKGSSTFEFLLRRMQHKTDFPAMSAAITNINRLAASEKTDAGTLANAILKDLALTNKILRLANSAAYNNFSGGGRVSTVSRAIVILGFETVRNLAISLMLFDHIRDRQHADKLRDEFLRANLCGFIAQSLSRRSIGKQQSEQAFICGLFNGLGRLLARFYFREESDMVERLIAAEHCTEETAAARVLGMTYPAIGTGVAEIWGFPETLVNSMRPLPAGKARRPEDTDDELRLIASCAAEFGRAIEAQPPGGNVDTRKDVARRYAAGLEIDDKSLLSIADEALEQLRKLSRVLNIVGSSSGLSHLLDEHRRSVPPAAGDPLQSVSAESGNGAADADKAPEAVLAAGIQDISQALVDEKTSTAQLLGAIAEIIYRALGARRVLVCRRDESANEMRGRHGFGENVDEALSHMRFALGGNDLFNLILAREVDVLVSDASSDKIRKHLPDWFFRHLSAQSFIVLPLRLQNRPVAMIYAESARPNGINVSQEALGQLRTLRNQALLAIKLEQH